MFDKECFSFHTDFSFDTGVTNNAVRIPGHFVVNQIKRTFDNLNVHDTDERYESYILILSRLVLEDSNRTTTKQGSRYEKELGSLLGLLI